MKNIIRIILPVLLVGCLTTSCATTIQAAPTQDVVITKVHHPKVIVHKNVRYYRSKGKWYVKKGKVYRRVKAPIGARMVTLPRGYKVIKIRGVKYYTYNGVYYKRSGKKYIIVTV
ncbi:DUF6515 family protein [Aquimarina sp. 2201CG1-2-11]|uniref:DUF6515 family protein n=1 Tax=Aquimarina discodermiae TaxID=3231043 RepID=UPI0034625DC7